MKTLPRNFTSPRARLAIFCAGFLALASVASATTYTVTTVTDFPITTVNSANGQILSGTGTGQVTLRSAVIGANQNGVGPHTVNVPAGTYNLSQANPVNPGVTATNGLNDLQVGSNLSTVTIIGTGVAPRIVQTIAGNDVITTGFKAGGAPAVVTLTLNNLEITGGTFTGIFTGADDGTNRSGTTITNCNIHDNTNGDAAFGQGGAIQNGAGSLSISGSTFTNNRATNSGVGQGGAIFHSLVNASGTGSIGAFSVTTCTFNGNTAAIQSGFPGGGAIFVAVASADAAGGAINITGCTFSGNQATGGGDGGAIAVSDAVGRTLNIKQNNFISNQVTNAAGRGGAIEVQGGTVNVNFNRFATNTATTAANGQAIYHANAEPVNANDNWWTVNTGPGVNDIKGVIVTATTWLQLRNIASPNPILINGVTTLTADILGRNSGGPTAAANLTGLPTFPASPTTIFSSPVKGTLSGAGTQFVNGQATATFTAGAIGGIGGANAAADSQAAITASITINEPPAITSATGANFTVGVNGSFTVTTTGFPAPPIARTGVALPSGVTFIDNGNGTGTLAGIPAGTTGGSYAITFTANNGIPPNAVQNFTLSVEGPPILSNIGKIGNEDTQITFAAANFDAGYTDPNADVLAIVRITSLPANGTLKLSGVNVVVNQDIPRANLGNLTFDPALNFNGGTSFSWLASDGTLFAVTAALVNITVNAVNDAPVLAAIEGAAVAYTENAAATPITGTLTVSDVDSANLVGATVQITGNYANGQDLLEFANQLGITGVFTPASGLMTLSGTTTVANYQTALRAVAYRDISDNPSTAVRTVTFQVNDGGSPNNLSNTAARTITVAAVNDPPVITGQVPISTAYNTARPIVFTDLTVTDPDNTYPTGFTLSVQNGVNYTRVGNIITPSLNFYGTLSVPVKVNDGTADSNTFNLVVTVNPDPAFVKVATNIAPEPGGGYRIKFIGNPGQTYTIQFTPAMAPLNWQLLGTRTADANGNYSIVDIPPANTPMRFYRSIFP